MFVLLTYTSEFIVYLEVMSFNFDHFYLEDAGSVWSKKSFPTLPNTRCPTLQDSTKTISTYNILALEMALGLKRVCQPIILTTIEADEGYSNW